MSPTGKSSNLSLAIVLLAAGEGSRLGSIPKALLRKDGKTLLEHFCQAVEPLRPLEFMVVTGFHADAIEAELAKQGKALGLTMTVVRNRQAEQGLGSSVRLALENLHSQYDVLAVCLSDQPNISKQDLTLLLEQFAACQPGEEILLPQVNGQRGNPVLFSRKAVESILTIPKMVCRLYMDQNPNLVKIYRTNQLAFIQDVDTDTDIQKLGITRI
jgi:molybdenum cofactor cytidylyltransferase/nicotine blue oxidoreductase